MTTLVWDGRFLAADSMSHSGYYRQPGNRDKILVGDRADDGTRLAYAVTGFFAHRRPWIDWYRDSTNPPPAHVEDGSDFFVLGEDEKGPGVWTATTRVPHLILCPSPDAWGSGGYYAIGAMLAGKNAMEAVEIAIKANYESGGPVRFIDTQDADWQVKTWGHFVPAPIHENVIYDSCGCTGHGQACMKCRACLEYYRPTCREVPTASIWRDCEPAMTTGRWPGYPTGD